MKKIILAIVVLIIIFSAYITYQSYTNYENRITTSQAHYNELRDECKQKDSVSCCLSSVEHMENANAYKIANSDNCEKGYKKNLSRCMDSFTWCEKEKVEDNSKLAYYQKLRANCETKEDKKCCLTSLEDMERVGAQEKVTEECPKGTKVNGLLCVSSYQWCEDTEKEYQAMQSEYVEIKLLKDIKISKNIKLPKNIITEKDCAAQGGEVWNTLGETDYKGELIGRMEGLRCPCACLVKNK